MRQILLLLTAVCLTPSAFAAKPKLFSGRIASYDQLMRMDQKTRAEYMHGLMEVVALMEKAQSRYETAGNGRLQEMKEQVALLMQMMSVLPEAQAAEGAVDTVGRIVPKWDDGKGSFTCAAPAVFDPNIGTCAVNLSGSKPTLYWDKGSCPDKSTHEVTTSWYMGVANYTECVPKASWDALPKHRQAALDKGEYLSRNGKEFAKGVSKDDQSRLVFGENEPSGNSPTGEEATGAPPAGAKPAADEGKDGKTGAEAQAAGEGKDGAKAGAPRCAPPSELGCQELSSAKTKDKNVKARMADVENKFRTGMNKTECITAGFFSKYRGGVSKKGGCEINKKFPENGKMQMTCGAGEALCNPVLFCVGYAADSKFKMANICVRPGANMTRNCAQRFDEVTSGKKGLDLSSLRKKAKSSAAAKAYLESIKGKKAQACDLSKDLEGFPLKEEFGELKKSIESKYASLCGGDSDFLAMFCTECSVIGKQIWAMNDKAKVANDCGGGMGSAPAAGGAPATGTQPAGEGGADGVREKSEGKKNGPDWPESI